MSQFTDVTTTKKANGSSTENKENRQRTSSWPTHLKKLLTDEIIFQDEWNPIHFQAFAYQEYKLFTATAGAQSQVTLSSSLACSSFSQTDSITSELKLVQGIRRLEESNKCRITASEFTDTEQSSKKCMSVVVAERYQGNLHALPIGARSLLLEEKFGGNAETLEKVEEQEEEQLGGKAANASKIIFRGINKFPSVRDIASKSFLCAVQDLQEKVTSSGENDKDSLSCQNWKMSKVFLQRKMAGFIVHIFSLDGKQLEVMSKHSMNSIHAQRAYTILLRKLSNAADDEKGQENVDEKISSVSCSLARYLFQNELALSGECIDNEFDHTHPVLDVSYNPGIYMFSLHRRNVVADVSLPIGTLMEVCKRFHLQSVPCLEIPLDASTDQNSSSLASCIEKAMLAVSQWDHEDYFFGSRSNSCCFSETSTKAAATFHNGTSKPSPSTTRQSHQKEISCDDNKLSVPNFEGYVIIFEFPVCLIFTLMNPTSSFVSDVNAFMLEKYRFHARFKLKTVQYETLRLLRSGILGEMASGSFFNCWYLSSSEVKTSSTTTPLSASEMTKGEYVLSGLPCNIYHAVFLQWARHHFQTFDALSKAVGRDGISNIHDAFLQYCLTSSVARSDLVPIHASNFAAAELQQSHQFCKHLFLMFCGLPGSGKSTLIEGLVKHYSHKSTAEGNASSHFKKMVIVSRDEIFCRVGKSWLDQWELTSSNLTKNESSRSTGENSKDFQTRLSELSNHKQRFLRKKVHQQVLLELSRIGQEKIGLYEPTIIVYDACNAEPSGRQQWLKLFSPATTAVLLVNLKGMDLAQLCRRCVVRGKSHPTLQGTPAHIQGVLYKIASRMKYCSEQEIPKNFNFRYCVDVKSGSESNNQSAAIQGCSNLDANGVSGEIGMIVTAIDSIEKQFLNSSNSFSPVQKEEERTFEVLQSMHACSGLERIHVNKVKSVCEALHLPFPLTYRLSLAEFDGSGMMAAGIVADPFFSVASQENRKNLQEEKMKQCDAEEAANNNDDDDDSSSSATDSEMLCHEEGKSSVGLIPTVMEKNSENILQISQSSFPLPLSLIHLLPSVSLESPLAQTVLGMKRGRQAAVGRHPTMLSFMPTHVIVPQSNKSSHEEEKNVVCSFAEFVEMILDTIAVQVHCCTFFNNEKAATKKAANSDEEEGVHLKAELVSGGLQWLSGMCRQAVYKLMKEQCTDNEIIDGGEVSPVPSVSIIKNFLKDRFNIDTQNFHVTLLHCKDDDVKINATASSSSVGEPFLNRQKFLRTLKKKLLSFLLTSSQKEAEEKHRDSPQRIEEILCCEINCDQVILDRNGISLDLAAHEFSRLKLRLRCSSSSKGSVSGQDGPIAFVEKEEAVILGKSDWKELLMASLFHDAGPSTAFLGPPRKRKRLEAPTTKKPLLENNGQMSSLITEQRHWHVTLGLMSSIMKKMPDYCGFLHDVVKKWEVENDRVKSLKKQRIAIQSRLEGKKEELKEKYPERSGRATVGTSKQKPYAVFHFEASVSLQGNLRFM